MTPGNVKRLQMVIQRLTKLTYERTDALDAMYVLLEAQASLLVIENDLTLRPKVNSQ